MITDRIGQHEVLVPINHKNYNLREKKNSQVWKGKICIKSFYTVSMVIETKNVIGWFKQYNFECDWLIELSDNKLSDNKLSDDYLTNELVEKKEFFKPITIKEIVFFMINNSIKFKTNMDKSIIPPPSCEWTADSSFQALIKVTPETILIMYPLNDRDAKVSTEKPRKFFFSGK